MASSKLILCSNKSAMPEILGDAGLYFDPDNPDSIAKCIENLFDENFNYTQFTKRAYNKAKNYSWKKCSEETFNFIRFINEKILIISQYFYPNNFRINDLISKLSDKKYKIEIISSNVNYVSKTKSNAKINEVLKFPGKNFFIHRLSVISRNGSSFIGIALEYLTFIITEYILQKKYYK